MKMTFIISASSRKIFPSIWLCGLLCSVTTVVRSQTIRENGALSGKVLDANHAAIVAASLSLRADRFQSSAVTDDDGAFSFKCAVGEYTLTIQAPGFATVTKKVRVTTDKIEAVEIVLPVANSTVTVTVVATEAFGYRADFLNTATRTLTSLRDTPQSISVVSKEQIQDQSMSSIAEVVSYVPGITAHQGENNRDQLVIRGVSSSADFFRDGVRDDVQYYRDLYNVDRVEALKGPNAMVFGRGGGGGIVNRAMKEAGFTRLREFTLEGGSLRNRRVTGDIVQPINGKFALRLNGVYENSGSFRRFVNLERYGLNPTLTIVPGAHTRITVSYEHFHDTRVADRGIPSFAGRPVDVPIETYFGNANDSHVRATVDLLSSLVAHQVGKLTIRNRSLFGNYDRGYQNYVPGVVNTAKALATLSAYNNATKRRNFFDQTDLTYVARTGPVKHTLLGGTEAGRQLTDNFRNTGFFNNTSTSIQVSLSDPTTSLPVTFRQSATDANNHLATTLAAAFIQDQVELSRRVQVLGGVRFDYFDLKFHNNRTGEDFRRIDRLVSPRLGLVIKPLMPLSLYASYSISYLPSSGDQFSSLTTVTQQVKPEKFTNYEVGAKWDVRPNLTLTTALYRQDRTNTRATDPNDATRILQTGSQRSNGFEAGISGNVTPSWSIAGGYAHQNAFISSATTAAREGALVALVPRNTFSLWNKYQVVKRLALGFGVVHRSDMFAAIDNAVTLPGYTKIDAAAYVRLAEKWKLQAHFENLLNQTYYLTADGNNNISPGSPRAVKVTLIFGF
jgi:catecholate siderophore receptor